MLSTATAIGAFLRAMNLGKLLKPWNKINDPIASSIIIFRLTLISPCLTIFESGTSLNGDGVRKLWCLFIVCQTNFVVVVGRPAMMILMVAKIVDCC